METIYYFVDESYREHGEYWHCNIGGAFVHSNDVVDLDIAIETEIYRLAISEGFPYAQGEFKYTSFFPDTSDEFKLKVCTALADVFAKLDVRFLISHAFVNTKELEHLTPAFGPPAHVIQRLAHINTNSYLAKPTETHIVQMVVDLGISESFRPIYDIYAGALRSIPMLKARGITDDQITIANYRRLPRAVFMDSKDSRVLQFSDMLIGLTLSRDLQVLTPFKTSLLERLAPIMHNVQVLSVEWNKDGA
jgi:hypothetical protein